MIQSKPSGAKILLNGVDSGYRTPIRFAPRHLPLGLHSVSVEKDGYKAVTPPQPLWIKVSAPAIIFSILVFPVFLIQLVGNRWQGFVQYPRTPFVLEKIPDEKGQESEPPEDFRRKEGGQETAAGVEKKILSLKRLLDKGLITQEEYDNKKTALLENL